MTDHNPQPHPDCVCQSKPLDQGDLTRMYQNGEYEEINKAFAAGRFHFNDTEN